MPQTLAKCYRKRNSKLLTSEHVANCYTGAMRSKEFRRANLLALLEKFDPKRRKKAFAQATGLNAGHVSQMASGHRNMGDNVAQRIEHRLKLSPGWMDQPHSPAQGLPAAGTTIQQQTGGSMRQLQVAGPAPEGSAVIEGELVEEPEQSLAITLFQTSDDVEVPGVVTKIPVLDWVQAGKFCETKSFADLNMEDMEYIKVDVKLPKRCFALRVKGRSMMSDDLPTFPPGILIICNPDWQWEDGDFVIAVDKDYNATFKQIEVDGPSINLVPLNKKYDPIKMEDGMCVCAVVIGAGSFQWFKKINSNGRK